MIGFLDRVTRAKRDEVAQKKQTLSLSVLTERVDRSARRDLESALTGGERIIAEIKRRSPVIDSFEQTESTDGLASIYETNGASAVSVVTDIAHFGMSLANARDIRKRTTLPVLVKDFVFDPYQVYEARSFGADALLLIVRLLDRALLQDLLALTGELGMQALVEVHSEDEIHSAREAGARIIGINNRDLDSLEVSLDATRRLADRIAGKALVVSESGISTREQIEELSALGVDAFLIGGALLSSQDPGAKLRTLLGN